MPGKIVTFYSYQGGNGRSMALANAGWAMAESGLRVLALDWQLSAPSLHLYFERYLDQERLQHSPGLVEFLTSYLSTGTRPKGAALKAYVAGLLNGVVPVA